MKSIITTLAALAAGAALSIAEDAPKKAEGEAKPAAKADAFAKKDTNNDGSLSKEEFVAGAKDAAKAEAAFAKRDKDGDGKLTREEFAPGKAKKEKAAK